MDATGTSPLRAMPLPPERAERAAELLRTASALAPMSERDARCAVSYMRLLHYAAGSTVLREGDDASTSHLLLVLSGDVKVESTALGGGLAVDISVIGAGHVIGELALIDGAPRSTTCTALSAIEAAGLSRQALNRMLAEEPRAAAQLLIALLHRTAERLRALGDQIGIYAGIARDLRAELQRAAPR